MLNDIRYVERTVSENFGDSFHDLENTNYWELLKILNSKKNGSQSNTNNSHTMNAYEYMTGHAVQ